MAWLHLTRHVTRKILFPADGLTDDEIVAALAQQGLVTSERSLQRRLQL
jgi:hypothetical protein